jgi:hypothetical protein
MRREARAVLVNLKTADRTQRGIRWLPFQSLVVEI